MLKKSLTLAVSGIALIPSLALAWNSQGHVTVAEIAYQNLTPAAKAQADALADKAYKALPADIQERMNAFEGASLFAKIAMAPDYIRKEPAEKIWAQMGETIPASLNRWEEKETGAWHYINQTIPADSNCNFVHEPNIKQVGSALYQELQNQPQAANLMFLAHVAGDAHQPMHTTSKSTSDSECINNLGGNLYTLDVVQKDLHHLWDSGLGLLDEPQNIHDFAQTLQQAYPKAELGKTGDFNQWLAESYKAAEFGYSVTINTKPTEAYYQQGTELTKQRLSVAGYRLADMLNSTFR